MKQRLACDDPDREPTTLAFVRAQSIGSGRLQQPHPMAGGLVAAAGLAGVVEDLGYPCSQSEAAFASVLSKFPGVDESAVAGLLGMMVRTHSGLEDRHGTQVKKPDTLHEISDKLKLLCNGARVAGLGPQMICLRSKWSSQLRCCP